MRQSLCRKARISDLDRILALETASFGKDAFSRRQLRYLLLRAKGAVYVALRGGQVAGYVCALTRKDGRGRIYSLCVDDTFRRQGVAGALLDAALAFLLHEGSRRIFLEVEADNAPAIALYEKKGFARHGLKTGYYKSGGDAVSMMREPGP